MGARDLLSEIRSCGVSLGLNADGLTAGPRSALSDELRASIRANRQALIAALLAEQATPALASAINRCCEARGDEDAFRLGLLHECSQLSPDGKEDLRQHFERQAERWAPIGGGSQ